MPIKNSYEIMKIILFDTSRKDLGRYFGVLIAWIVLNNVLLPICIGLFAYITKRNIMKAAKREKEEKFENERLSQEVIEKESKTTDTL